MAKPILETVLQELNHRRGDWPDICSRVPGITYWWLTKVVQRKIADPGVTKIQALYDYFLSHPDPHRQRPSPSAPEEGVRGASDAGGLIGEAA